MDEKRVEGTSIAEILCGPCPDGVWSATKIEADKAQMLQEAVEVIKFTSKMPDTHWSDARGLAIAFLAKWELTGKGE